LSIRYSVNPCVSSPLLPRIGTVGKYKLCSAK
jgi:hypothetical protein